MGAVLCSEWRTEIILTGLQVAKFENGILFGKVFGKVTVNLPFQTCFSVLPS